jgi:hypothetical protein
MRVRKRIGAWILAMVALVACGGRGQPAAYPAGPPSAAVEEMKVPDSPYYIIYHPPVSLARASTGSRR